MTIDAILESVSEEAAMKAAHLVCRAMGSAAGLSRSALLRLPSAGLDGPHGDEAKATAQELIDLVEQETGLRLEHLTDADRSRYLQRIASAAVAIVSARPVDEQEVREALGELRAVA